MGWRRARFKDVDVWAEVDAAGALAARGGRVSIRYKPDLSAKVYSAGANGVALVEGEPAVALSGDRGASGFGSAGSRTVAQAAMAVADAKAKIGALSGDTVVAYTDGACRGNPGPAGAGALLVLPDGGRLEASLSLGVATNNVGELAAIGLALDLLDEASVALDAPVRVFSDSKYARGVLAQGWKAKANGELIRGLRARLATRPGTRLEWVAGHTGLEGNERADALAGMGVSGIAVRRRLPAQNSEG
jgi:ribonuclease HI